MLSLGTYPATGLALAKRRDDARRQLAAGVNPSSARQADKAATAQAAEVQRLQDAGEALPGSFEAVAREWWASVHSAKVSEAHAARTLIRLEQDAFPWIGARPIAELKAADVLACARRVVERGAVETAHRLKDACGQVFRYGVAKSLCERNPVADLKDALPPVQVRHLAALTDPGRVAQLLRDARDYQGQPVTRATRCSFRRC
jgi:integrase